MLFPTVASPVFVTSSDTVKVAFSSSAISSVMGTLMQRVSPSMDPSAKLMFMDVILKSVPAIAEAEVVYKRIKNIFHCIMLLGIGPIIYELWLGDYKAHAFTGNIHTCSSMEACKSHDTMIHIRQFP